MNWYALIVFVHVAGAVGLLGGSVIGSPAVRAAVRRAQTVQEMRAYLAIGRPLQVLEPASAVAILATGVYLTQEAGFWGLGWVQIAVVFWVVNAVAAGALVKPILGRLAAEVAGSLEGPLGRDLDELRWSRRWSVGGDLLMANDATALYLMVMKPDLLGSLLAVVAVNLVAIAARAVRRGYGLSAASTPQSA